MNKYRTLFNCIKEIVETAYNSKIDSFYFDDITDPFEYENAICNLFQTAGFKAYLTRKGADQGIDVIAEKDNLKIGVQCKLYSQKVGNSAVQEALSGKAFYTLNIAIVVSNAEYTKSALQLAKSSNIKILHHEDLQNNIKNLEQFLQN